MVRRLALVLQADPDEFAFFAEDQKWNELEATPEDSADEDRPVRRWAVPGGELRFVDDAALRRQYIDIVAEPSEPIEAAINEEFPAYDEQDWLTALDFTHAEKKVCQALHGLAATAVGPVDQGVVEATLRALEDDRVEVRICGLKIPMYARWPEFLPVVTRLAKDDPNDWVRSAAASARVILEATQRLSTEE
jgi:hypothetical protein